MKRLMISVAASLLLTLALVGPVGAAPIGESPFDTVYVVTCDPGTVKVPSQYAHSRPGWDVDWAPADNNTPWILMYAPPPGLVAQGRLIGPCSVAEKDGPTVVEVAYFLHK